MLAVLELPVANPSPVFGVALLLGLLLLGLSIIGRQSLLVPLALLCTLAVEGTWHANRFDSAEPWIPLVWYLGFYAIFTAFPFVFRRSCDDQVEPWIASALSGAGHFLLVHDLVRRAFSEQMGGMMGLLPAAFAVPTILALLAVLRTARAMDKTRRSQLAWFGGVALLFITLIFPIQFDRQWLTVSWALEGAAVLWLFRRVPHPGLKWTGLGLLAVAFVRLALNPAVLRRLPAQRHRRSSTGISTPTAWSRPRCSSAAGGCPTPSAGSAGVNLRAVLYGFGGVLLFLLLNIEIADFFTEPGERFIAFHFGGNFARDMTYSIAWGLFALGLLGLGIWRHATAARYAAIGLLVRHPAQGLPPRPLRDRQHLPDRRADRRRRHRLRRLVPLSAILQPNRKTMRSATFLVASCQPPPSPRPAPDRTAWQWQQSVDVGQPRGRPPRPATADARCLPAVAGRPAPDLPGRRRNTLPAR